MIVVITENVKIRDSNGMPTGDYKLVASHGINEMMQNVCLPTEHPLDLGAKFDSKLGEWVIS